MTLPTLTLLPPALLVRLRQCGGEQRHLRIVRPLGQLCRAGTYKAARPLAEVHCVHQQNTTGSPSAAPAGPTAPAVRLSWVTTCLQAREPGLGGESAGRRT